MKQFTIKLSVLVALLGLISVAVALWVPALSISAAFPYILLFLYLSTLILFGLLSKSLHKRTSQFANAVMLVNFGKLVFYAVIIFIYAYINRADAVSFILTFFAYYFVITTLEVFALLGLGKNSRD